MPQTDQPRPCSPELVAAIEAMDRNALASAASLLLERLIQVCLPANQRDVQNPILALEIGAVTILMAKGQPRELLKLIATELTKDRYCRNITRIDESGKGQP